MELRELIQRSKARPDVYAPALAVTALQLEAERDQLAAENKRLRASRSVFRAVELTAERDLLKQEVFAVREQHGNALIERDQLREERDRLKAALSKSKQTAERWREDCLYFWSMS